MQRTAPTTYRLIGLVLLALFAQGASAQIGPNAAEIPLIDQSQFESVDSNQASEKAFDLQSPQSESQSVRPAIEEMLIERAAAQVVSPSSATTGIARDMQVTPDSTQSLSQSLPIGASASQTKLIGAPESTGASAVLDKGYLQTIVSLLGVLLLIVGLAQVYKRLARSQGGLAGQLGAGGSAPSGIIEVIGRYPISKGMTLVVLKFDRRVLLLSHASSTKGKGGQGSSMQVLSELTDPEDIASILLKSRTAAGETIAQSFEQTLRQADGLTEEHLYDAGHDSSFGYSEVNPVRFPAQRTPPVRTITTDEGDRAELWSSGQDSRAAASVLRKRLATMRREQQG